MGSVFSTLHISVYFIIVPYLKKCTCFKYDMFITSYLNDSSVWLPDEVPVSLFQPTQVQGVDRHMGAYLSC